MADVKLTWIKPYHDGEAGQKNTGSPDINGNCTRCGREVHHEDQMTHNMQVHL